MSVVAWRDTTELDCGLQTTEGESATRVRMAVGKCVPVAKRVARTEESRGDPSGECSGDIEAKMPSVQSEAEENTRPFSNRLVVQATDSPSSETAEERTDRKDESVCRTRKS